MTLELHPCVVYASLTMIVHLLRSSFSIIPSQGMNPISYPISVPLVEVLILPRILDC